MTIKQYNSNTADMFLYAWGLHFLKYHVKNKQQWGSLVYLAKKKKKKKERKKKEKRTEKLYPEFTLLNISLYWVSFKI